MIRLLALVVLAGCAPRTPAPEPPPDDPAPTAGSEIPPPPDAPRMAGTVVSVDRSPMAYDGDARIEVETDHGQRRTVFVAARMTLCEASGLGLVAELAPGDRIRVVGEPVEGGFRPCAEPWHLLARSELDDGAFRGLVYTGFETSAFRPCEAPDELWWHAPADAVSDRMVELRERAVTGDGGRGLRLVYLATLAGEVRRGDRYGHLGRYEAEFATREAAALEVLAVNPDTTVTCPAP